MSIVLFFECWEIYWTLLRDMISPTWCSLLPMNSLFSNLLLYSPSNSSLLWGWKWLRVPQCTIFILLLRSAIYYCWSTSRSGIGEIVFACLWSLLNLSLIALIYWPIAASFNSNFFNLSWGFTFWPPLLVLVSKWSLGTSGTCFYF